MNATSSINLGNKYPFDASDSWWNSTATIAPPPAKDWAHSAARGVIADLKNRSGIKHGFNDIDEETRVEIVESIAEIIREASKYETTQRTS